MIEFKSCNIFSFLFLNGCGIEKNLIFCGGLPKESGQACITKIDAFLHKSFGFFTFFAENCDNKKNNYSEVTNSAAFVSVK